MSCLGINEMAAYLDDTMSGEKRAASEEHVARCALCRKAAEELRQLMALGPIHPGPAALANGRGVLEEWMVRPERPAPEGNGIQGGIWR